MTDDRLPSLIVALDLNDPTGRENAIIQLGEMRDPRAVDALSRVLVTQDNSHAFAYRPRRLAAQALGNIGDVRAIPALLMAIEDIHPLVRGAVAEALGAMGDADVLAGLMTLLKDEVAEVRHIATTALGKLGTTTDIPTMPFLDLLADSSDDIRTLGREIFVALGMTGAQTLINGLAHPNSTIRGACAELLGVIKAEEAYATLQKVARNDASKWVRSRAEASLSVLPKPEFQYPTFNRDHIPPPKDTLQKVRNLKADWSNLRSRKEMPSLPPIPTMPIASVQPTDPQSFTAEQIQVMLDQLDVRLANGEISEATHQQLYDRWQKRLDDLR